MFEIKTLKDGLKKIAPRTKTRAITDDNNKSLDTILSEKANSTDVPSKVSQLTNDAGFITNAALANYPNNTQMNAAINSHHDSTKQDKLAAQTPYTNVGSKSKIPKITTNTLGQVINVEEVDIEAQQDNLNQNLAYANTNDTSIVTNVSDDLLLSDNTTYIEAKKSTDVISNGLLSSVEKAIARFSKDYFSIKNTNEVSLDINKVLANALLLNGSQANRNPVSDLNEFYTGIGFFTLSTLNIPDPNKVFLVISATSTLVVENQYVLQIAFDIDELKTYYRNCYSGTWNKWTPYVINNLTSTISYKPLAADQGRILNERIKIEKNRATDAESTLTTNLSNEVTRAKAKENELNTKFADYLLKSDAPGYADILTKTLAGTTYIDKASAPGYNDILTSADASTTYVSKNDAPGYGDILTTANAKTTYATITSVNAKQDELVSGTNIKTINNESLLGSGNIELATKAYVDSQIKSAINDSY